MKKLSGSQSGVTLVELMIATLIFSITLLIIIGAFLFVSKNYIKGYVESQTQETTRAVMQQVIQDIQLNNGQVRTLANAADGSQGICLGNHRYSFQFNKEIGFIYETGTFGASHGLVLDSPSSCASSSAQPISSSLTARSKELLGDHMRLGAFSVTGTAPFYTISLTVAYGGSLTTTSITPPYSYACPGISFGGQFCATSSLQTSVQQRVTTTTGG